MVLPPSRPNYMHVKHKFGVSGAPGLPTLAKSSPTSSPGESIPVLALDNFSAPKMERLPSPSREPRGDELQVEARDGAGGVGKTMSLYQPTRAGKI